MENTEEEKAKLEAEEAEAKAYAEAEAKDDKTTEEEDTKVESESDEESKQFEAELKREREAREKAEKALAEGRYKRAEQKRKEEQEQQDEVEEEDKPLTARQLEVLLAKEREATRKEMQAVEADRIAASLSTSDTQKQLILEIHKNRSFPAHLSLEEQIEESYLIANKKRIIGENSELKRALKGKQGVSKDSSTTHHDSPSGSAPKIAASDAAELARVGFVYNSTAKRYEKKLANGTLLVKKDLKSPTQNVKA